MLFLHNRLKVAHQSGATIEYSPVEALKRVNDHEDLVTVSYAESWLASRKDSPHRKVEPAPDLAIDYEKLKIQEKILFFDEVVLYEDELDDNGCAKLSVKMRAMPSGFFILLRFYLRVDMTLIRLHDTRLRYEEGADFILREYSEREQKVEELKVSREIWTDHNEIVNHLPVSLMQVEKLLLPAT